MKRLLSTIIMFSFALLSFGQEAEYLSFKIKDNAIIWQNVYNDSRDIAIIQNEVKHYLSDATVLNENSMSGKLNSYIANLNGRSRGMSTIFILNNSFSANVKIDFKQGRYRVTLSNIITTSLMDTPINGHEEKSQIELFCMNYKKGVFRDRSFESLDILDESLKDTFAFKTIADDDDW